jgi:Rieske Fe-S protein
MLRPSNIVLGNDGAMLVAGFGLMHMLQMSGIDQSNHPYTHLLSVAETLMITPEYVAPEIVQGQAIDRRSDVYALGAILFELLSGRPPFTGQDTMEVALQHVNQPAPSLRSVAPEVPVALTSVVNQALEREPERRFQRVSELVEAFAQVSRGMTGELRNTTGSLRASSAREATGEHQTGSWQLLPPIVTGKLGSIPSSTSAGTGTGNQIRRSGLTSGLPKQKVPARQNAPAAAQTGKRAEKSRAIEDDATIQIVPPPAQAAPAPAQMRAAQSAPAPVRAPQEPLVQSKVPASEPARSAPTKPEAAKQESAPGGMKPFDWWSMPGQFEDVPSAPSAAKEASSTRGAAPNAAREVAPARPAETARPQQTIRLSDASVVGDPWGMEPMMPSSSSMQTSSRSRSRRRSKGMPRRQVVAMLAGGGVLAAAGVTAFTLLHAKGPLQPTNNAPRTTTTGAPASKSSTTAKTTTSTKPTTTASKPTATTTGHTGTVIAKSNIPLNSAVNFTNPTTGRADILVHLPSGQFVAYDRACTHQGVLINYDPNTHMMVCPLHGSIFNPANNGKVVQGPALTPVPGVPIKINADGTVTTV